MKTFITVTLLCFGICSSPSRASHLFNDDQKTSRVPSFKVISEQSVPSILKVAIDGLTDISELLNDMKDLATKAQDNSLSSLERGCFNEAFLRYRDEIENIALRARWKGISPLSGGSETALSEPPTNGLRDFSTLSSLAPGDYAFRYDARSKKATLTKGLQKWTKPIISENVQEVTFANGLTAHLGEDFSLETNINQTQFRVTNTLVMNLNVQVGQEEHDLEKIGIIGTTLQTLELEETNVTTCDDALNTFNRIETAQDCIALSLAGLNASYKIFLRRLLRRQQD